MRTAQQIMKVISTIFFLLYFALQPLSAQLFEFTEIKYPPIAEQLAQMSDTLDLPKGRYSILDNLPQKVVTDVAMLRGQRNDCMHMKIEGRVFPLCVNYRIMVNGDTILFDSPQRLQESFTPLRTAAEAIQYVQIVTDYIVVNDFFTMEKTSATRKESV